MQPEPITSPADLAFDTLCAQLAQASATLRGPETWPTKQLQACAAFDVFSWFVPVEAGGQGWSEADLVRGYLRLSKACLTTAFVITQRTAAVTRIVDSENDEPRRRWLPDLVSGRAFSTVAISHLTTSRRHLQRPVLSVRQTDRKFVLDGYSPWVTGATQADLLVVGATDEQGLQSLFVVPRSTPGLHVAPPYELVALAASQTGQAEFRSVEIDESARLAGPAEQVMRTGRSTGTGGLQTSTLAVGLADAALEYLEREAQLRRELVEAVESLRTEWTSVRDDLLAIAAGSGGCSSEQIRARANSLVLRVTQTALAAAKGTGFVAGHPAGRWCREALFFLVWSCPQGVLASNLCEWAGLEESS